MLRMAIPIKTWSAIIRSEIQCGSTFFYLWWSFSAIRALKRLFIKLLYEIITAYWIEAHYYSTRIASDSRMFYRISKDTSTPMNAVHFSNEDELDISNEKTSYLQDAISMLTNSPSDWYMVLNERIALIDWDNKARKWAQLLGHLMSFWADMLLALKIAQDPRKLCILTCWAGLAKFLIHLSYY